jgi:hypothetical protein
MMWSPQTVEPAGSSAAGITVARPVNMGAGVTAVTVDGSALHQAGQWVRSGTSYQEVQRVLPVGDRLVAVTYRSLQLLDPDGLRPLATVPLG